MEKMRREQSAPLMRRDITYIAGVQMEEAVEIVRHCFFRDEEMEVFEKKVCNPEEFRAAYMEYIKYWNYERCIGELHEYTGRDAFYYYGKCAVCNTPQPFLVDYQSAGVENGHKKPNWQERLVCANCKCNSRQRFLIGRIFADYTPGKKVLLYERVSNVYDKVAREIEDVTGFEYGGVDCNATEIEGIHCEDICKLSYADESFDLLLACDVFEHTTEFAKAFEEAYRVLKKGGKLLFTVPFDGNSVCTLHRVEMGENGLVSTEEPWYHSSAIASLPPLLVCQIFGWDILEALKESGFKDAYGKVYYGLKEGYLGYLPLYFEACK